MFFILSFCFLHLFIYRHFFFLHSFIWSSFRSSFLHFIFIHFSVTHFFFSFFSFLFLIFFHFFFLHFFIIFLLPFIFVSFSSFLSSYFSFIFIFLRFSPVSFRIFPRTGKKGRPKYFWKQGCDAFVRGGVGIWKYWSTFVSIRLGCDRRWDLLAKKGELRKCMPCAVVQILIKWIFGQFYLNLA